MNPQSNHAPACPGIPRNRRLMRAAALDWREAKHLLDAELYRERPALPAWHPLVKQWQACRIVRGMRAAKLLRRAIQFRDGGAR